MNRRVDSNHALAHAVNQANALGLPVLYYEGLTCSYPGANDRLHTFVLEGVAEQQRRLRALGIGYCFYLRRRESDPNDVLYRLAEHAACVVSDDYPVFLAARNNASVPAKLTVQYEVVDSSCVVPMSLFEKTRVRRVYDSSKNPAAAAGISHALPGRGKQRGAGISATPRGIHRWRKRISRRWSHPARLIIPSGPRSALPAGVWRPSGRSPVLSRKQPAPLRARAQRAIRARDVRVEPIPALRTDLVA